MADGLIKVDPASVPRGRGTNPLSESVEAIAEKLTASPGEWFVIGSGEHEDRSRLNNAASLLKGKKYAALREYDGKFEAIVSGAKDASHADQYEVAVFARYVAE